MKYKFVGYSRYSMVRLGLIIIRILLYFYYPDCEVTRGSVGVRLALLIYAAAAMMLVELERVFLTATKVLCSEMCQ
jgi:hypothetical protein